MSRRSCFPSPRLLSVLLAAGIGLGGCATTTFTDSDPAYRLQAEPQTLPAAVPGSARVAVRWTQVITPAAQSLLEEHWVPNSNDVIWNNPVSLSRSDSRPQAYQEIPSDSAYYAAEFARFLGRRIPLADISLEPLILDVENGRFIYKPLVRNRFPAQMVVDLWMAPLTHRNVHPAMQITYSVATAGLASPATCGVLAFKPVRNIMPAFDAQDCGRYEPRDVPHPDLIYGFATEQSEFSTPIPLKQGVPFSPGLAVGFPPTYETFTSPYLEKSGAAQFDAVKDLSNPTLEELAKDVADGLGRIDPAQATQVAWRHYVAVYDPPLAQRLQSGAMQPTDAGKLQFIAQLADAERAWVGAQDQAVLKTLLDGNFGKSFRATRLAMDKQYQKEQMMGWASAIAMMGTMGAASALGSAGSSMAAMQANMQAMQIAAQSMSDSQQASEAFYQQFGAEIAARQQVVEVNYSGTVVKVQAENLGKLYAELTQLYQSRVSGVAPKKTARKK